LVLKIVSITRNSWFSRSLAPIHPKNLSWARPSNHGFPQLWGNNLNIFFIYLL
jgi:hypothetical protein